MSVIFTGTFVAPTPEDSGDWNGGGYQVPCIVSGVGVDGGDAAVCATVAFQNQDDTRGELTGCAVRWQGAVFADTPVGTGDLFVGWCEPQYLRQELVGHIVQSPFSVFVTTLGAIGLRTYSPSLVSQIVSADGVVPFDGTNHAYQAIFHLTAIGHTTATAEIRQDDVSRASGTLRWSQPDGGGFGLVGGTGSGVAVRVSNFGGAGAQIKSALMGSVELDDADAAVSWVPGSAPAVTETTCLGFVTNVVDVVGTCGVSLPGVTLPGPNDTQGLTVGPDGDVYAPIGGLFGAMDSIQKFNADDGIVRAWDVSACAIPGARYVPAVSVDGVTFYFPNGSDEISRYAIAGSGCQSPLINGAASRTYNTIFARADGTFYTTNDEGEAHDVTTLSAGGTVLDQLDGPEWSDGNEAHTANGACLAGDVLWLTQNFGENFYAVAFDDTSTPLLGPIDIQSGSEFLYFAYTPFLGECTAAIVVTKSVVPTAADLFAFTATGMLPAAFLLGDGDSQAFSVIPGSGYAVAETPTAGWSSFVTVSNGSSIDNLIVAADETVTVSFINRPYTTVTYPICRKRRFPLAFNQNLLQFLYRLEFLIQSGQSPNAPITIRLSKDGGETWPITRTLTAGTLGDAAFRVYASSFGQGRNWVCEFITSEPYFWALIQCYADLEPSDR